MEKLKECPFCGGNASHVYDTEAAEDTMHRKWAYTIVCDRCAASTGLCFSREQAIKAWNRMIKDGNIYLQHGEAL